MQEKEKILYVDDEQENLIGFKYTFRNDFQLFLAQSAKEGLEIMRNHKIKAVITDQRMPEMTGVEFLEEIVKLYPDTVRIILTGYSDMESIIQAINKGRVHRYIAKPWDKEDLRIAINNAIHAYNLKEENLQLIDSLKNANTALKAAKEKAEESDRLKSSFLANISHEIRTPLNAIAGFSALLSSSGTTDIMKRQFVEFIEKNIEDLLSIIDDILDISLIEAGQITVCVDDVDINEMTSDVFINFKSHHLCQERPHILYNLNIPKTKTVVKSDKYRLKQILSNFISNAFKFTDQGIIEVGVDISNLNQSGTEVPFVDLYVRDTGIGIPENKFEYIFERFKKIEDDNTKLYRGTGLGLAISKSLARILNAEIILESKIKEGSLFTLRLPLTADELPERKLTISAKDKKYFWPNKTVLVVEDVNINYLYLKTILEAVGINIVYVTNGSDAIEVCKTNNDIDVVLMDIQLPGIDGYEATQIIKSYRKNLAIIATTAYAMSEDKQKSLDAGCDDYIAKPINRQELYEKLNKFFKK